MAQYKNNDLGALFKSLWEEKDNHEIMSSNSDTRYLTDIFLIYLSKNMHILNISKKRPRLARY